MPTPTKPANVIRLEKKSHRTKKELASRENAEKALLTGENIHGGTGDNTVTVGGVSP